MPKDNGAAKNYQIAMLIDGDNAQSSLLDKMLAETEKYGKVIVRRIYGNWDGTPLDGWKKVLHKYAFTPVQQFQNTPGKNATDIALTVDAMKLLNESNVDCFCIVSSDSDYTALAMHIRSTGRFLIGIGKKQTPQTFCEACDKFIYVEKLDEKPTPKPQPEKPAPPAKPVNPKPSAEQKPDALPQLKKAFESCVQENGWADLGALGNKLIANIPKFNLKTYGVSQLSSLFEVYPQIFELDKQRKKVRLVKPPSPKKKNS